MTAEDAQILTTLIDNPDALPTPEALRVVARVLLEVAGSPQTQQPQRRVDLGQHPHWSRS